MNVFPQQELISLDFGEWEMEDDKKPKCWEVTCALPRKKVPLDAGWVYVTMVIWHQQCNEVTSYISGQAKCQNAKSTYHMYVRCANLGKHIRLN